MLIYRKRVSNDENDQINPSNATLTAGSYYYVPADAKHITRCAADSPVDCVSYFYQDTPFDFAVDE